MIAAVRHVESDLVQARGPAQELFDRRIRQRPGLLHLRQEIDRRGFDTFCLDEIDVVALLHAAHRALARIFVGVPAQQVVEQAFAHRAIRHAHGFDAELLEHLGQDRHAARRTKACDPR